MLRINQKSKFISTFVLIVLSIGLLINFKPVNARSFNIITRIQWNADDGLIDAATSKFSQKKTIGIFDIQTNDDTITHDTKAYLQGLYYYLSSNFNKDLPFNYLVGWDGNIYEGASKGIGYSGFSDNISQISIGYLDNGFGLNSISQASLNYLITNLNGQTGIGISDINAASYSFNNGIFSSSNLNDSWKNQINTIKLGLKGIISDASKQINYSLDISKVSVSNASDGNNIVNVAFTNKSSNSLYGRIYAGSDNPSPLYVQNVWISNQRSNYTNIQNLDSNASTTFSFEIASKVKKGTYTLNLYLDDQKISTSIVNISINEDNASPSSSIATITPAPKMIKVLDTNTGFLNVRDNPSLSGKIIGKVTPGQTFELIQQSSSAGNGWDQIKYDGTNLGWISSQYTSNL